MECAPDLVRIEGSKFLAKFEFGISAAGAGYCILESGPNGDSNVTKSTTRWSTALSRSRSMARPQICIGKLIGTEPEGRGSGFRLLPPVQSKLAQSKLGLALMPGCEAGLAPMTATHIKCQPTGKSD